MSFLAPRTWVQSYLVGSFHLPDLPDYSDIFHLRLPGSTLFQVFPFNFSSIPLSDFELLGFDLSLDVWSNVLYKNDIHKWKCWVCSKDRYKTILLCTIMNNEAYIKLPCNRPLHIFGSSLGSLLELQADRPYFLQHFKTSDHHTEAWKPSSRISSGVVANIQLPGVSLWLWDQSRTQG